MSSRIKDNPSAKNLQESVEGAKVIKAVVDLAGKFGLRSKKLDKILKKVPELAEQTKRLLELPDRFSDVFGDRGWIAYESLEPSVMEKALDPAATGKPQEADQQMVNYYDEAKIALNLRPLQWREEFALSIAASGILSDDDIDQRSE
jgi:hypothetical protein